MLRQQHRESVVCMSLACHCSDLKAPEVDQVDLQCVFSNKRQPYVPGTAAPDTFLPCFYHVLFISFISFTSSPRRPLRWIPRWKSNELNQQLWLGQVSTIFALPRNFLMGWHCCRTSVVQVRWRRASSQGENGECQWMSDIEHRSLLNLKALPANPEVSLVYYSNVYRSWSFKDSEEKTHEIMQQMDKSGQIIIFHQPRFPWNKGNSLSKPPFAVRSCEVAIIWPDKSISSIENLHSHTPVTSH